jgi:acetylornithine deacetylase/succinyl-diaminopimelate desuccinylase-like protein
LNNTWMASMEITGMDGIPSLADAGNVLRPYTTAKFALRLPPTTNAVAAKTALTGLLTSDAPNSCEITIDWQEPNAGWHTPETTPALEASLQKASQAYFGAPAMYLGCGGSIPMLTVPMSFCISPPPRRSPPALPHCFTTGDKGRGYRLLACQRLARR